MNEMIVPSSDNLYSDESEDGAVEIDIYVRKYQLLLERCEVLQQDNERLANRIQKVKKLLRRNRRERKFLMERLDRYGDSWRSLPLPIELDEPLDEPFTHPGKSKIIPTAPTTVAAEKASTSRKNQAGGNSAPKRKTAKAPVDPNAPKRPANPFFQFCQEQRTTVLESLVAQGLGEPSKQEVTKQLAIRWNALPSNEKKIYYDMYEKSKVRYAADMQLYSLNKASKS
ncbi:TCF3 fusion partner homolog [Macrosteles quadrilineatus]|uniref:TCF3 fusion partner homolog n=1 Tax=Macrosteles quadrilineatus TaxID=74068 RepID=UPI0023E0B4E0|nr:TCF3 fusion partner homolog [Macrosteles quadrilineatus]XP_054283188.1 TCF3 fusion partner homolog [Macrosteles quadrilineatus]